MFSICVFLYFLSTGLFGPELKLFFQTRTRTRTPQIQKLVLFSKWELEPLK